MMNCKASRSKILKVTTLEPEIHDILNLYTRGKLL